jgi:hypothetical protein
LSEERVENLVKNEMMAQFKEVLGSLKEEQIRPLCARLANFGAYNCQKNKLIAESKVAYDKKNPSHEEKLLNVIKIEPLIIFVVMEYAKTRERVEGEVISGMGGNWFLRLRSRVRFPRGRNTRPSSTAQTLPEQ